MAGVIDQIDAKLEELISDWNVYTTVIAVALVLYSIYPLVFPQEPDTHPFLLSRQSNIAAVRQPGESAVYRSLEVPHGYPLKSGLNVKEPGASKWAGGKDGDIRDIWRRAIRDPKSSEDSTVGNVGTIFTIRGKDTVVKSDMDSLTKEIVAIGSSIHRLKGTKVALYLPNSVELLCSIFAAAFYGFSPVLIPYHTPPEVVINYLQKTKADFLVAEAGSLPLAEIKQRCPRIHSAKWVVPETSRQMDWTEDVDDVNVLTWHEVCEQHTHTATLPENKEEDSLEDLVFIWQGSDGPSEVHFSHKNVVSATSSLSSALPNRHRLGSTDLVLPADSLTHPYVLCQIMAALFANASIALNSQAEPGIEVPLVCRHVKPTIIIASPESALKLLKAAKASARSVFRTFAVRRHRRSLASGTMPTGSSFPTVLASPHSAPAPMPMQDQNTKLRLIYISERTGTNDPPLSSSDLNDLRAFTGARVIYALTAAMVAGAIAQTGFYDYRVSRTQSRSHFGAPVSSVEVKVVDQGDRVTTTDGSKVEGNIVVRGPAVVGGEESNLGILGRFTEDGTLELV